MHMKMTIGQLAQKSDTDPQTVRYYERQGLIAKPIRTTSNYRLYDLDTIDRLTFIKRAKEIGFSLRDIKKLLEMADGEVITCSEVKEFAETRLTKIHSQLSGLKAMEKTLSNLVKQCENSDKISECPILETLSNKK